MKADYPFAQLCVALGVSCSGVSAWINQRPRRRVREDQRPAEQTLTAHTQCRKTESNPRMGIECFYNRAGVVAPSAAAPRLFAPLNNPVKNTSLSLSKKAEQTQLRASLFRASGS